MKNEKHKKHKKHFGWLLVIALTFFFIIPSVLNYILTRKPLCGMQISDSNWVGFWGGYLGAIVTSLCLWLTIAYNRYNLWLDAVYERNEKVKDDIVQRIELLRTSKFLIRPFFNLDKFDIQD